VKALVLMLALALTAPLPAASRAVIYISPEERLPLVELFTSQGCSSCPPADHWLSRLLEHPGLWRQFVPLAFHVDYWDYIGWQDRFAEPRYSARQRAYREQGRVRSVYTPGFVVDGWEWQGFFGDRRLPLEPGPKVGRMTLELMADSSVKVRFKPLVELPKRLTLHVARLGFGLKTAVGRGENAGRELREEFVVLGWHSREIDVAAGQWKLPLPKATTVGPGRQAVAAWLSEPGSPVPIQAVGGWLR